MWELLTGEEPYSNMRSYEIIGISALLHFYTFTLVNMSFRKLKNTSSFRETFQLLC